MRHGDPYGLHRVLEPVGTMPQAAWKLDNEMVCYDNEILIEVEVLNIDSASFTQIKQEAGGNPQKVGEIMQRIVRDRGKHHNPVTGSGGMLVGRVREIGSELAKKIELASQRESAENSAPVSAARLAHAENSALDAATRIEPAKASSNSGEPLKVGDRVATLVSLSLTPLTIDEITRIDMKTGQVDIKGHAILFESGIYAKMPDDLPDRIALAVFDVCGAPAQTAHLVKQGDSVVLFGAGGKSGLTVLRQARLSSETGKIVAVEYGEEACNRVKSLGWADVVLNLDATKPAEVFRAVSKALGGELADVVINCVNVPNTEMSSILCAKDLGTVYFFSMATSFTAAALGAEGVGKDVNMVIGNGYCHGHANHAINLVRNTPELLSVFEAKFAHS